MLVKLSLYNVFLCDTYIYGVLLYSGYFSNQVKFRTAKLCTKIKRLRIISIQRLLLSGKKCDRTYAASRHEVVMLFQALQQITLSKRQLIVGYMSISCTFSANNEVERTLKESSVSIPPELRAEI